MELAITECANADIANADFANADFANADFAGESGVSRPRMLTQSIVSMHRG